MKHHAYTRVDRYKMRATTATPWRAHCEVCCLRSLDLNVETAELMGSVPIAPTSSWYAATQPEALGLALSHLASHVEVAG